jgi:hypothetical protein
VPSLPGYQYAHTTWRQAAFGEREAYDYDVLVINQYIAGEAKVPLSNGAISVKMETDYPLSGKIKVTLQALEREVNKVGTVNYGMSVLPRIPDWAQGKFKIKTASEHIDSAVDGKFENGGMAIFGWSSGSKTRRYDGYSDYRPGFINDKNQRPCTFEIEFPMEPQRMIAHPKVTADLGRVAIQRGPLVYCFEQCDNDVPIAQIKLAREPEFKEELRKDLLGGMVVLKCKNADGKELTAIPYYTWDHREPGAMAVWVRQEGLSRQQPPDTKDNLYAVLTSDMLRPDSELEDEAEVEVSASYCNGSDFLESVIAGNKPKNSNDQSMPRMTFWNHKGTQEWIALDFGKAKKVSQSSVYWFDDTGRGQCRVPKSWTLSYRSGEQWIPVKTSDSFDVAKDRYNVVKFESVETTGLRLDIQLQENVSGGVLDWKCE